MTAPLPISPFRQKVAELVQTCPAPGKHAARSAIRHLERGWNLRAIDPEFAVLHAITAEEEAARAIFHALQRHKYPGSDRLRWQRHEFKAAVVPFFRAVSHMFADMKELHAELVIETVRNREELRIRAKVPIDGEWKWLYPEPPLDYQLSTEAGVHDFVDEIRKVVMERNAESVREFIRSRANWRNRSLYASDQGLPNITNDLDAFLPRRCDEVYSLINAFLLIDQHRKHQLFVLQTLDVFLKMMDAVSARE